MEITRESMRNAEESTSEVAVAEESAPVTEAKVETSVETQTPVEEQKKETTEVKTEVKEEVKTEAKKESLFDKFKTTEIKEPVKQESVNQEVEKEISDLRAAKQELERIKNHGIYKVLNGDFSKVEDVEGWLKSAIGVDYSKMSAEQLIAAQIHSKYPTLSEAAKADLVKEDVDQFETLSESRKEAERIRMAAEMSDKQPKNELLSTLEQLKDEQKTVVNPEEYYAQRSTEDFEKTFNDVHTKIQEISNGLVGQKYGEYEVTADDAKSIADLFTDMTRNFDPEKVVLNYFKAVTSDKREVEAEKRGFERGLKEAVNPSVEKTTDTFIAATTQEGGVKTATRNDFKNAQ